MSLVLNMEWTLNMKLDQQQQQQLKLNFNSTTTYYVVSAGLTISKQALHVFGTGIGTVIVLVQSLDISDMI